MANVVDHSWQYGAIIGLEVLALVEFAGIQMSQALELTVALYSLSLPFAAALFMVERIHPGFLDPMEGARWVRILEWIVSTIALGAWFFGTLALIWHYSEGLLELFIITVVLAFAALVALTYGATRWRQRFRTLDEA